MPSSTNVPSSISRSIRSRAVSLPASCCLAVFSSPPPSLMAARRSARSSTSGRRIDCGWVSGVAIGAGALWKVGLPTFYFDGLRGAASSRVPLAEHRRDGIAHHRRQLRSLQTRDLDSDDLAGVRDRVEQVVELLRTQA